MPKSPLTASVLSLGSYERDCNKSKVRKDCLEDANDDYVTKRRKRWTPKKCSSLQNLTPQSRMGYFRKYELFRIKPLGVSHPNFRTIWRAYNKFIVGAWTKTRTVLISQSQRTEVYELQERSALMQMSLLSGILDKDKEIMRDQTNQRVELSNMVALSGNDQIILEQCNRNLNLEIETLMMDVEQLDRELSRKNDEIAQLEIDVAKLKKSSFKKEEKRDKCRIEMGIKKARVEQGCKEYELNYEAIEKIKPTLEEVETNRNRLLTELQESQTCFKAASVELQREADEFGLLKKKLAEINETKQVTAQEQALMETRIRDQDLCLAELETKLLNKLEELEHLGVPKAHLWKWGKFASLASFLALCLFAEKIIRIVDRRWP